MNRYRLTLRSLKFLSAVDFPAQEPAVCVLTKRKDAAPDVKANYRVTKMDESLGLVIGMSIITSIDGVPYTDLQGDEVQEADLLKTVVGFMEAGAPTDTQHNREADGRVVLSWVFDQETNKAMDITARKHGWATGLKVSPETFAKFKSGEYTGFSIDGTGEREPIEKSSRVVKHTLHTDVVDGHQHQISIWDNGEMYVHSATSEGADNSHSHGIACNADGAIEILLDSGHTHALADGQAAVVIVPADAVVVVQASATRSKSTTANAVPTVGPHTEPQMKTIVLTEAQHAHYSKLSGEGAEAFLAKSASDRDAIVKAAADADPIVFKGESGIEVRKSHGDLVLQLAKQNDAMAKAAKEQADAIAKAKADLETEQLTKRAAADIGNLAGETAHKVAALRALDSITDQAAREGAIRMLKSADEFAKAANKAPGVNPETPAPDGPKAQFDALVAKHATDNKVDERTARLAVVKTAEGRALYTEIENLRKRNALPAAR